MIIEAVKEVLKGEASRQSIAEKYGVSRRTLGRWVDAYKSDEAIATQEEPEVAELEVSPVASSQHRDHVTEDVEFRVIATSRSISITKIVDERVSGSVVIDNNQGNFKEIFDVISKGGLSQECLKKAFDMAQPKTLVETYTEGRLKVDIRKGVLTYNPDEGEPFVVSGLLSKRIIDTIQSKGVDGAKSLINFFNKLMNNPSNRSVNELYGFLEHNDIEINEEGNFLAWKAVRDDYFDIYSNTIDNSVGKEVRVPRNQVDEDSERTCSYGLHVAAKGYIPCYGTRSSRVVQVEVDPADVVAVPADYGRQKLRCAGYKVVKDVTDLFW